MEDFRERGLAFYKAARETFERIKREEPSVDGLLRLQSNVLLNLADASLYLFAAGDFEGVEEVYGLFSEVMDFLRENGLFLSDGTLLQLGALEKVDLERGFSLDRRFSSLGVPKPVQVWANRIIRFHRYAGLIREGREIPSGLIGDPFYALFATRDENDRSFGAFITALRRLFEHSRVSWRLMAELLKWELLLGTLEPGRRYECPDGVCETFEGHFEVSAGFREVRLSDEVSIYERREGGKRITLELAEGSAEMPLGEVVELIGIGRGVGFVARKLP
ncbi:hypothetical protein [Palaeococcus ferrophilus]|uniref:hypothetical protein n=1 Tax=Palaeococcus ferrophilus TaxID=83868 RepID=UPI00069710B4|nr:hypothetical protein [Palaeococcus ferrophilus]